MCGRDSLRKPARGLAQAFHAPDGPETTWKRASGGRTGLTTGIRTVVCLGLIALPGCDSSSTTPPPIAPHQITQVSVINALMLGQYDGLMPVGELLRHGDFGVGTFDHLDGELIVLDGKVYQARGDGVVVQATADRSTPFAIVTPFAADGEFPCPQVGRLVDLEAHLDDALRRKNHFVAIRVDARFGSITLRSVPRQVPPYRPLAEVARGQSVWTHKDLTGTLVGIRCPVWAGGLNVPGYHWHFLSDDRKLGGHVLDCRVREGRVRHDVCRNWLVTLGDSVEFDGADLGKDQGRDLQRVEHSRDGGPKALDPTR